ncbi:MULTISPECIES: Hsp70 family protein [Streptomyces]|nr:MULTISPECIES: Hsp70 family protein [Streptomyces]
MARTGRGSGTVYAIDLGGSVARVAWLDERGEPVVAGAPADVGGADGAVPAAVRVRPGGGFEVGRAARERALTHPNEVALSARSLLLEQGNDGAGGGLDVLGQPPAALVGQLLAALVELADGGVRPADGERAPLTLSLPPSGGERALRGAAEGAGLRVAAVLAEPVAVALHYGAVRDGARSSALVYDQGGTSLDLTVLTTEGDRTVRIVHTASHPLGGDAWDEAVAAAIRPQLAQLPPDVRVSPLALARAAEELRLALARGEEDVAEATLPGTEHRVRLSRAEEEAALAPLRALAYEAVEEARARADALLEVPPSTLLLAGGVAAAPGTAALLEDRLGMSVRSESPEFAVVRGLALWRQLGPLRVQSGPPTRQAVEDPEPLGRRAAPPPVEDPDPRPAARPTVVPAPEERSTAAPPGPVPPPEEPTRPPEPEPPPGDGARREPTAPRPPFTPPPEEPGPGPAEEPGPAGQAPPAGQDPPTGEDLVPTPVTELDAIRRDDHLLVVWVWPAGSRTALVRWRLEDGGTHGRPGSGEATCSRRAYEHDGGFELDTGYGAVSLTVEALVPGRAGTTFDPPARLRVAARPPVVSYEPSLRRTLKGRVARLAFRADASCHLPALIVVHGTGRYRPGNPGEGRLLHEIPPQRIDPGAPTVVEFPFTPARGDNWLVCFPARPTRPTTGNTPDLPESDAIVLRSSARHRL